MFDENGWEEPNTWDEFFELLEEIQSENITPLSLGTADAWVVDEIVASGFYPSFVGGEDWRLGAIDGDNKLTDSEYVSFLENLTKWPEYKIGRASCRERMEIKEGASICKDKRRHNEGS